MNMYNTDGMGYMLQALDPVAKNKILLQSMEFSGLNLSILDVSCSLLSPNTFVNFSSCLHSVYEETSNFGAMTLVVTRLE
jgi:hypothetical protein